MRIIAGTARGRRIEVPSGLNTRPTSDRIRESIFNILGQFFDGGAVLDLYAGSGALGLEAISRGANRAVLVERDREAARICSQNVEALGFGSRVEVIRGEAADTLRRLAATGASFDLLFVDPPYAEGPGPALDLLGSLGLVAAGGRVVAEHDRRHPPAGRFSSLESTDLRSFGATSVSFFERPASESP